MAQYVLYALPVALAVSVLVLALRALVGSKALSWVAIVLAVASVGLAVASVVIVRNALADLERAVGQFDEAVKDAGKGLEGPEPTTTEETTTTAAPQAPPSAAEVQQCAERLYRTNPENRATESDRAATRKFCEEGN